MNQAVTDLTDILGPPDRLRHVSGGQVLFTRGDAVQAIYRVVEGRLRLIRVLADGNMISLQSAGPGDSFAEASLFSDHYHCDGIADTASTLAVHDKAALLARLAGDTEMSRRLMAHLARQVMDLRGRVELRNIRRAEDRLLAWIGLRLTGTENRVHLDGPLRDLAAELGLTQESLYRAVARLKEQGRLSRDGDTLILHDSVKA